MSRESAAKTERHAWINALARVAIRNGTRISALAHSAGMPLCSFQRELDPDIRTTQGRLRLQMTQPECAQLNEHLASLIEAKNAAHDSRLSVYEDDLFQTIDLLQKKTELSLITVAERIGCTHTNLKVMLHHWRERQKGLTAEAGLLPSEAYAAE